MIQCRVAQKCLVFISKTYWGWAVILILVVSTSLDFIGDICQWEVTRLWSQINRFQPRKPICSLDQFITTQKGIKLERAELWRSRYFSFMLCECHPPIRPSWVSDRHAWDNGAISKVGYERNIAYWRPVVKIFGRSRELRGLLHQMDSKWILVSVARLESEVQWIPCPGGTFQVLRVAVLSFNKDNYYILWPFMETRGMV